MNYWLVKSEPYAYSWDDLCKTGKGTWDGVRNYQARNNLKSMKVNDLLFFYHSNEGMEIVGIAKVVKEFYQDPTTEDNRWVVVDVEPVEKLNKSVTLASIKKEEKLQNIALIKHSRLSVMPLTADEFNTIISMSQ
jgi:predicted RNA-binding protein with PUA-like domain